MGEKLKHLPEVLAFKLGIAHVTSLGVRTSWYRHKIASEISALSRRLSISTLPTLKSSWYFLGYDGTTGFEADLPCQRPELFQSLSCSTTDSLTVLNTSDAELLSLLLVLFAATLCYLLYRVRQYRVKLRMYEEIRERKQSIGLEDDETDGRWPSEGSEKKNLNSLTRSGLKDSESEDHLAGSMV